MNTISISRRKFAQLLGCRRGLRRLCGEQKRQNLPRMKYWEIIADDQQSRLELGLRLSD
jgi:hypothetical protein